MNGGEKTIDFDQVADLYDDYVRTDIDVPLFLKETEDCSGEILELMAGTGRLTIPLLRAKRRMVCVDYAERMLAALRRKAAEQSLQVTTICMDATQLRLGRQFERILLPFHAFAEIVAEEGQRRLLTCVRDHLAPGGFFLCTLHNPAVRARQIDGDEQVMGTFPRSGGGTVRVSVTNCLDASTGIVTGNQRYELFDASGQLEQERFLPIRFRLVARDAFEQMVSDADLRVDRLVGDYAYGPFDEATSPHLIHWLRVA